MPPRSPEEQARALLLEVGIDEIPVRLDRVASHVQARIIRQRMDNHLSGMTYRQDDVVVIGINSNHHRRRQRFTLAHELGHFRMHPGKPLLVDSSIKVDFRDNVSSLATDQQEIEANQFAAALLMPETLVRNRMRASLDAGVRGRDRLVAELADAFDVSTEAMGYRLINLGLTGA
jgi:Zn-dependent peptidase ImmA (M78 family)